jgi:hypothetical protein
MGIQTLEVIKPSCHAGIEADEPCMLPATEYSEQCGSWLCHTHFSDANRHECVLMAVSIRTGRDFD